MTGYNTTSITIITLKMSLSLHLQCLFTWKSLLTTLFWVAFTQIHWLHFQLASLSLSLLVTVIALSFPFPGSVPHRGFEPGHHLLYTLDFCLQISILLLQTLQFPQLLLLLPSKNSPKLFHQNFPPNIFHQNFCSTCLLKVWIFEFRTIYLPVNITIILKF